MRATIRRLIGRNDNPNLTTREARRWSNEFIRAIAPAVEGNVVNVSAWKDEDKEGRHYRDYFTAAASYTTTNYDGWRGADTPADYSVDLLSPVPDELKGRFDCVFNHTTLEHIYDCHRALLTLCDLSSDAVLIIVPWMQQLHGPEDGDFWRFSPYAMRRMLADNGFEVVAESAGPTSAKVQYLGHFAARDAAKWRGKISGFSANQAEAMLREAI